MTFLQSVKIILHHVFSTQQRYPLVEEYERAANRIAQRCVDEDRFDSLVKGMRNGGVSAKPASTRKKKRPRR